MFKIVRHFLHRGAERDGHLGFHTRTIKTGLTLDQAQAHCGDPKTHMAGYPKGKDKYRGRYANWFDGYEET